MLKIIEERDNNIKIMFKNLDRYLVNSIRRVIMSDIGGYAFDEIEIKKNTTIFHDELIKHRIGLIPVDMGSSITFSCSLTNLDNKEKYVLSNDIVCLDENVTYRIMDDIPIVVLDKDQEIDFTAKTNKDISSKDIKYSLIESIKFLKMKKMKKRYDDISEYLYEDMYYGRKYLLEGKEYEETTDYYMEMTTIMKNAKQVMRIGLMKLRNRLVNMRDLNINDIERNENYYNFKISDIDYVEASIFVSMLLKREDIKIATYTRKHLLDKNFEFKIEFNNNENQIILKIKEEEMDKVIKKVDKLEKYF